MLAKPTIIGIAGIAASGKTTLTSALAKQYNAAKLHFDDYATDATCPADLPRFILRFMARYHNETNGQFDGRHQGQLAQ